MPLLAGLLLAFCRNPLGSFVVAAHGVLWRYPRSRRALGITLGVLTELNLTLAFGAWFAAVMLLLLPLKTRPAFRRHSAGHCFAQHAGHWPCYLGLLRQARDLMGYLLAIYRGAVARRALDCAQWRADAGALIWQWRASGHNGE